MPANKREKREKGKGYGESIAHNCKKCPKKSNEQAQKALREVETGS